MVFHPFRVLIGGITAAALGSLILVIWSCLGPNPALQNMLGMSGAAAVPAPRAAAIVLDPGPLAFQPQVTAVVTGSRVTFTNQLTRPIRLCATALSPASFHLTLAPHAHGAILLSRPGLYQYFDALSAHPRAAVAGNTVLVNNHGTGTVAQGWIAVIDTIPGLRGQLVVPRGQDLFTPKVVMAVVGSTIVVANHDTDTHNFVIDPASPAGAAFVVTGTDGEPPAGWQRSLVVQQQGLYHVYCTLHTQVVGSQGGWRVLVPRSTASGYADHDPMEAWIIVLPATVTL